MTELVVLVLHELGGNLPRPRIAHRGLLSLNRVNKAGCPGTPVMLARGPRIVTVVLKGDKRRPSGQGPGARFYTGSHPTESAGVTGSPRPSSQPAAPP